MDRLIMAANLTLLAIVLYGCSSTGQQETVQTEGGKAGDCSGANAPVFTSAEIARADEMAEWMSAQMPTQWEAGISTNIKQVQSAVSARLDEGDTGWMAYMACNSGLYGDSDWYSHFLFPYVYRMSKQMCRPIHHDEPLKNWRKNVAAMKAVASGKQERELRVLAAIAIRSDEPALALNVLKEEYGDFHAIFSDYPLSRRPTPSAPTLEELGFRVPMEITTADEIRSVLSVYGMNPGEKDYDTIRRFEAVADYVNHHMHDLLQENKLEQLRELDVPEVRRRFILRAWREVEVPEEPQIWTDEVSD